MNICRTIALGCAIAFLANGAAMAASTPLPPVGPAKSPIITPLPPVGSPKSPFISPLPPVGPAKPVSN